MESVEEDRQLETRRRAEGSINLTGSFLGGRGVPEATSDRGGREVRRTALLENEDEAAESGGFPGAETEGGDDAVEGAAVVAVVLAFGGVEAEWTDWKDLVEWVG